MIPDQADQAAAEEKAKEMLLRGKPGKAPAGGAAIPEYFWPRAHIIDDCWEWRGVIGKSGYGQIIISRRTFRAHRVAYVLAYGGTLKPDDFICHRCDNTRCIRPSHLFLGTAADNSADMMAKGRNVTRRKPVDPNARPIDGRYQRGEQRHNAKLNEDLVRQIRSASGSTRALARQFSVDQKNIVAIRNRKAWRHVT